MRTLDLVEMEHVSGGFGESHADGGGSSDPINQFDSNNLGARIPYYENGQLRGFMVADGTGTRYVDGAGRVQLTEEGRELAEDRREEERRRFQDSPFGRAVDRITDKVRDIVNPGG